MDQLIVELLRQAAAPMPTRTISAALGTDPATVSDRLNCMADMGLVDAYELPPSRAKKYSRFGWMLS